MPGELTPYPARHWHRLGDGRLQCDVCPRNCRLRDGQRGFCYVRVRDGDEMVLATYGRASGFCVDPIEKKPLAHFHPGSSVLSFGTAGCNLGCRFCQNWDITKARTDDRLQDEASPQAIARAAEAWGCRSVAVTYNDPVVHLEYAVDVARACRDRGISTVAVTAGYVHPGARSDLFGPMDAVNVDLKSFSDHFYETVTGGRLAPVLDTIGHLVHETSAWVELTTLLIPGHNDGADELGALFRWVVDELGPEVPHHLTAFHPDHRMRDVPPTPPQTLRRARDLALSAGLRHVYLGNVLDRQASSTYCAGCGVRLVERDRYAVTTYRLTADGRCPDCGRALAGRFGTRAESFGNRRIPVSLSR